MNFLMWLKSLFGAKQHTNSRQAAQASLAIDLETTGATQPQKIAYYSSLVEHLQQDHQHLIGLYSAVLQSIEQTQYAQIVSQLEQFKSDFHAHLQAENIKLYGFLEQSLAHQTEEFKQMRQYRREMRSIESVVNQFLSYWIESRVGAENIQQFIQNFQQIGAALVKRIESEENALYPMYQDCVTS